ncbi:hypothetical protein HJG60_010695 [Phyllostomus discolor]|uniref:Uncharacterized protein n=1 Tax=Phyllostomus discolor TaxID=89673 RepID=A0A834EF22_9CHIR|nr:hypothetical protein HJG60_010695 [Phyllostomus discolor]
MLVWGEKSLIFASQVRQISPDNQQKHQSPNQPHSQKGSGILLRQQESLGSYESIPDPTLKSVRTSPLVSFPIPSCISEVPMPFAIQCPVISVRSGGGQFPGQPAAGAQRLQQPVSKCLKRVRLAFLNLVLLGSREAPP